MQSEPKTNDDLLDIIFISYDESNCDKNWLELKHRFPRAKRVHGVQGIKEAHRKAANISNTHFFFVVDGDNRIRPSFNFQIDNLDMKDDSLYVYRCLNPVNGLSYGFGAVKIYNKSHFVNQLSEKQYVDFATTVTTNYEIVPIQASETHFFHNQKEAWRGAFRECAKLAAGVIARQKDEETKARLERWCEKGNYVPNRDWVLSGARQGRDFGNNFSNQLEKLNDFEWLDGKFYEFAKTSGI